MFWQFLQKTGAQLIGFVVSVILARLLVPEDYGVVALAGMFLVLMGVFSDGGLGQALIQKKEADDLDFDTMFVTQLVFAICVYVVVFFLSPVFADLFHSNQLVPIIRVMGLTMPLGALSGVQYAIVSRRMMFKWFFYASLASVLVSAIIGIYMAFDGYGAWALVGQSLSSTVVSLLVISCLLDWHPRFRFSNQRFRCLFSEGLKFMGTSFMGTLFSQLKGYALGLKYSAADLAFYNRGEGIPNLLCNNIDNTIQGVLFPALSKIQNDKDAVKRAIRRSIRISTFILLPMLFGLAAISDKLVIILYTEKWAQSIPFMQVLCVCLAIGIMCNVNLQALKATGNIGLVLKLEFIKKPIMLVIILGTMMISPLAIAYGMLFFNVLVYFINAYPNKEFIDYSYKEQCLDVLPNLLLAVIMSLIVYCCGLFNINIYLLLFMQIVIGVVLYLCMSYYTSNQSFFYILTYVSSYYKKHLKK